IVDTQRSERWPVYTRANVGEVSPNVTTPLMWSMIGGPPAEREWKQALVEFGAFDLDEFRPDLIDIQGMIHGYIYLNLSHARTFGARMPEIGRASCRGGVSGLAVGASSRRRHTSFSRDWSSDVCSSDLAPDVEHDRRATRGARVEAGPGRVRRVRPRRVPARPHRHPGDDPRLHLSEPVARADVRCTDA